MRTPADKGFKENHRNENALEKSTQAQKAVSIFAGSGNWVSSHCTQCIHAIEQERFLASVKLAYNTAAVFGQSVMDVFPSQMLLPTAAARGADLQSVAIPMERSAFRS